MATNIVFLLFSCSLFVAGTVGKHSCEWTMPSTLSAEDLPTVTNALNLKQPTDIVGKLVKGTCMLSKECDFFNQLDLWLNKSKIMTEALCSTLDKTEYCCPNLPKCDASTSNRNKRASGPHVNHLVTPTAEILSFNDTLHPNRQLLPSSWDCGQKANAENQVLDVEDIFPWIVRLGYTRKDYPNPALEFLCGGSLVSNRYVLTAAHCLAEATQLGYELKVARFSKCDTPSDQYGIVIGDGRNCSSDGMDIAVEDIAAHSEYGQPVEYRNDIALVRLTLQVHFTDQIRPVCLPFGKVMYGLGESDNAVVAGWRRPDLSDSDVFHIAKTPLTGSDTCKTAYDKVARLDFSQQFCAGGNSYEDTCTGNSGGPLMVKYESNVTSQTYVIGIVSFGPEICGRAPVPAVYTWVPNYLQWILNHIKA